MNNFHSLSVLQSQHNLDMQWSFCAHCIFSRCNSVCTFKDAPLPAIDSFGDCWSFVNAAAPIQHKVAA